MVNYAGTRKNPLLRLFEMIWKTALIGGKADYLLIDTYSTYAFWYAYVTAIVARFYKVPYVSILHGGDLPKRLKESKWACDKLFNNSFANVAVSGYLQHEFEKYGYGTILIPNSININEYPFRLRNHCGPRLMWVRSFHRMYNPNMAADVLFKLLESYPDAALCMVGPDKDGSMAEFANYIREMGIESKVKLTGKLAKDEWLKLSEEYDFFINTTNVDNTPVSVMEAMALGMCVVSTNPGGIKFLVEDNAEALLVNPGCAEDMAGKIKFQMLNHSNVKQITLAARKKVESFDWGRVKLQWFDLLN